jgi:hypothetical protein
MLNDPHDASVVVVKSIPPLAMTAWSFWGFTLNEWAAVTAILYTILMTIFLLVDRYKKWKKEQDDSI